ncbi:MAG: hypothetical protein M3442_05210 [Chloroflexota bacterium]|nr:hypothetical protein [Chloroflexota bacterium]
MANPINPITPSEGGGAWPRPRLSKRSTLLGVNYTQGYYVVAGWAIWDAGRLIAADVFGPLALPIPWTFVQGEIGWMVFCLALTVAMVCFTYHGLHLWQVIERAMRDTSQPRISVWRPVDEQWEERATDEAEEDERELTTRHEAQRVPVADESNPMGWVVD